MLCGGVLLRLTDTAGLRRRRTRWSGLAWSAAAGAAEGAALCLVVLDGSVPLTQEDEEALTLARGAPRALAVVNKADLPQKWDAAALPLPAVAVSAKPARAWGTWSGGWRPSSPLGRPPGASSSPTPGRRRRVERALTADRGARGALESGLTPDAALADAEAALAALGELTGKNRPGGPGGPDLLPVLRGEIAKSQGTRTLSGSPGLSASKGGFCYCRTRRSCWALSSSSRAVTAILRMMFCMVSSRSVPSR